MDAKASLRYFFVTLIGIWLQLGKLALEDQRAELLVCQPKHMDRSLSKLRLFSGINVALITLGKTVHKVGPGTRAVQNDGA